MTLVPSARTVAAIIIGALPLSLRAQGVALARNSEATVVADSLRAVSIAYTVRNPSAASVAITPVISAPESWTIAAGSVPFTVDRRSSDLWIVSLSIPPGTAAGNYKVAVTARGPSSDFSDSVRVVVAEAKAIDAFVMTKPSYSLAGATYKVRFVLRNAGNSPAMISLATRSARGRASIAGGDRVVIAPNSAALIVVSVATADDVEEQTQDITTLEATLADDASIHAEASALITIVPKPGSLGSRFNSVATELRLRPIGSGGGIAPLEISGGGRLREDGKEQIDFYCRGPVRGYSSLGERDECRAQVRGPAYNVRAGDFPYGFSPLTTTGESGMGAGADVSRGALQFGTFAEHYRWNPFGGNEGGGYVAWKPSPALPNRIAFNLVNRSRADLRGVVGSLQSSWQFAPLGLVDLEYARSRGDGVMDDAKAARLSRQGKRLQYDAGFQNAGPHFEGSQRGATYRYVNGTAQIASVVSAHVSYNQYDVKRSGLFLGSIDETISMLNAGVTVFSRFNVDAIGMKRADRLVSPEISSQRGIRVSGAEQLGAFTISGDYETGRTRIVSGPGRSYKRYSISPRISVRGQSVGGYFSLDDGNSALGDEAGSTAAGVDGVFSYRMATLSFNALRVKPRLLDDRWTTQADVRAFYTLWNGHTLGVRAHTVERIVRGIDLGDNHNTFYLEYGIPLNLPVFPRRGAGRVEGRVMDAATGKGMAGTLVSMGGKSGLTDRKGRIFFRGLEPGEYALLVGDERTASGSVLAGDARVTVARESARPARFQVALVAGGELGVVVRRYVTVESDTSATKPDILSDAGPMDQVMIKLAGARDTLYEATGAAGIASFGSVSPGHWTVSVVPGDLPSYQSFEPGSVDIDVEAGKTLQVEFRLVPVKREIKILADEPGDVGTVVLRHQK